MTVSLRWIYVMCWLGIGWNLPKDHLKPVMTDQVSLVSIKLFGTILKIFNSDNTYYL